MALLVPHEGDVQLLTDLLGGGPLENWQLGLFNSNITPAETDTAVDLHGPRDGVHQLRPQDADAVDRLQHLEHAGQSGPVRLAGLVQPQPGRPLPVRQLAPVVDLRRDGRHDLRLLHRRRDQRQADLRRGLRQRPARWPAATRSPSRPIFENA